MADFETSGSVVIEIDQSSLRDARRDVEQSIGSVTVDVDGSGAGPAATPDGGPGADLASTMETGLSLDEERNEILLDMIDEIEEGGGLMGGGGGGDGGGGLMGGGGGGGGLLARFRDLGLGVGGLSAGGGILSRFLPGGLGGLLGGAAVGGAGAIGITELLDEVGMPSVEEFDVDEEFSDDPTDLVETDDDFDLSDWLPDPAETSPDTGPPGFSGDWQQFLRDRGLLESDGADSAPIWNPRLRDAAGIGDPAGMRFPEVSRTEHQLLSGARVDPGVPTGATPGPGGAGSSGGGVDVELQTDVTIDDVSAMQGDLQRELERLLPGLVDDIIAAVANDPRLADRLSEQQRETIRRFM